MKKNAKGDFIISVVLLAAASCVAIRRFNIGETTEGFLWLIVVAATMFRIIRNFVSKK